MNTDMYGAAFSKQHSALQHLEEKLENGWGNRRLRTAAGALHDPVLSEIAC